MRITKRDICLFSFWVLAAICILNLNAVGRRGFGISNLFNLALLASCLGCLFFTKLSIFKAMGHTGAIFTAFFVAYLGIGLTGSYAEADFLSRYVKSYLIIVAAACGGWHVAVSPQVMPRFLMLFAISLMPILTIFFTDTIQSWYIIPSDSPQRNMGIYGNPNEAGFAAVFCFIMGLALITRKRFFWLGMLGVSISSVAILATFSRTAMLIAVVLVLFKVFQTGKNFVNLLFRLSPFVLLFAYGFYWVLFIGVEDLPFSDKQKGRLESIRYVLQTGDVEASQLSGRAEIWAQSIERILDAPLFGRGLGSFQGNQYEAGSHNVYLMIQGESGLLPSLLFLVFLAFMFFKGLLAQDKVLSGLIVSFTLLFAAAGMMSHTVFTERSFNLVMGLCMGLISGLKYKHNLLVRQAQARSKTDSMALSAEHQAR